MRLWSLVGIFITIFAANGAFGARSVDRNGDGRVDYVAVPVERFLDEKIDEDFDGRFDRWVLSSSNYEFIFVLTSLGPWMSSFTVRHDEFITVMERPSKRSKFKFSTFAASKFRMNKSEEDCLSVDPLDDIKDFAVRGSATAMAASKECSAYDPGVVKSASGLIRDIFDVGSIAGYCFRQATSSLISPHSLDRLHSAFKSTIERDGEGSVLICESKTFGNVGGQSEFLPLRVIMKLESSANSNSARDTPRIVVHELSHLLIKKDCAGREPYLGCMSSGSEPSVDSIVERWAACAIKDRPRPSQVLPDAPVTPEVSGQVGITKSASLTVAPVVPQAPMHELTFVKPTESWVPAPPRVAQITKDLAQPMIQYAERVWADLRPKVESELAMLPRAGAGEGRANRQVSSGTNVSKRDLDADTSIVDIKGGQSGVAGVVGGTPAPEKQSVERDVRKISRGNSQSGGLDADDAGDVGGETRTGAAKGTQSRRARSTSQARAGGSAGVSAPVTVASSAGQEQGEEPSPGQTAQSKSQASRGPAAIPRNALSETERRIITSLESRKVNAISGRELVSQLVQNPQLDQTLKRKGISIVDNSGGRWGADYKKAIHKYLVRGETITDMSD